MQTNLHPKVIEFINKYNVIMIMNFGSVLYGCSTKASDSDYKGIYLPTAEQILLQNIPKSISFKTKNDTVEGVKNSADDVEIELYSLNYFIDLCIKGETIGVDMLHCNDANVVYLNEYCGDIWTDIIRKNRSKFYTKNIKGFVGYCRKQAAKYGIRGSRIADARKVYEYLWSLFEVDHPVYLAEIWKSLPTGEHIHFVKGESANKKEEEFYQVCGKKFQRASTALYCVNILKKFIDSYGQRALLAEQNKGVDWKAMSHSLRYGYQIRELFKIGDIIFPLKQRKFLTKVKLGEIMYLKVAQCLEGLMNNLEKYNKINNMNLPDKCDTKYWNDVIKNIYADIVTEENWS